MNKLTKKINEFNSENEMLKCSLEQAKGEFIKELNEIIEYMRFVYYKYLRDDYYYLYAFRKEFRKRRRTARTGSSRENRVPGRTLERSLPSCVCYIYTLNIKGQSNNIIC